MKSFLFLIPAIAFSCAGVALAQHDHAAAAVPIASDAQKSFDELKTLAGSWEGTLTTIPKVDAPATMKVVLRVTSRGNAIMHEMSMPGAPDDPITMLYLDGDHLALTHYCDAGNRPRMFAKPSSDAKSIAFEVVDVSGSMQKGNMADTKFTILGPDHHIEEWTYHFGDKMIVAHVDLQRTKGPSGPFNQ